MSAASETTSSAAEASQVWLDTAAVIDGNCGSTGCNSAIFARLLWRGVSSTANPWQLTISRANRPLAMAAKARSWLCRAKASICSRLICQ
ncbi:hypothetical protein D9M73_182350 [compost metagenome]